MQRHTYVPTRWPIARRGRGLEEEKSFEPMNCGDAARRRSSSVISRRATRRRCWFADHRTVRAPARRSRGRGNEAAEIDDMRRLAPTPCSYSAPRSSSVRSSRVSRPHPQHPSRLSLLSWCRHQFLAAGQWRAEYCGATIHFLDLGVDTGPIVAHVRPTSAAATPARHRQTNDRRGVDALARAATGTHTRRSRGGRRAATACLRRADFSPCRGAPLCELRRRHDR